MIMKVLLSGYIWILHSK